MILLADKALTTTLVCIAVWLIAFPVLVQGLIVFAVIQARGEKRANEAAAAPARVVTASARASTPSRIRSEGVAQRLALVAVEVGGQRRQQRVREPVGVRLRRRLAQEDRRVESPARVDGAACAPGSLGRGEVRKRLLDVRGERLQEREQPHARGRTRSERRRTAQKRVLERALALVEQRADQPGAVREAAIDGATPTPASAATSSIRTDSRPRAANSFCAAARTAARLRERSARSRRGEASTSGSSRLRSWNPFRFTLYRNRFRFMSAFPTRCFR